ncbi:hypothetical protein [Phosphitispora sp. TUW77]|uniref:hypothetical protein n=1 Tax=Phosphitispora sp. TUW77 TaxID=3152361 RepID=UPI003AB56988
MKADNDKKFPKTQHKRVFHKGEDTDNSLTVLDNPDDRITEQTGNGMTIVTNDNPDDVENR